MRIGVPTEIKPDEYRVAITPAGVRELSARGHEVLVQSGAGEGSAMADEQFLAQGALIVQDADAVFSQAELVLKVKEPQPEEAGRLREGQTLFTYLHLAAEPQLARMLQDSGATCIAYETVEDGSRRLPLLAAETKLESMVSREASFLFNNLLFVGIAFSVLWGTLFPILSELVQGTKVTVGPPFFNQVNIPLGLALLGLTGIGPLIAWRRASLPNLQRQFAVPVTVGVFTALVLLVGGMRDLYALMAIALGAFVAGTVVQEFARGARARHRQYGEGYALALGRLLGRNRRRYGGYIVHTGMVVLFIAFAGMAFKTETEATLRPGESAVLKSPYGWTYTFTHLGVSQYDALNRQVTAATLEIARDGKRLGVLTTEKRQHVDGLGRPTFQPSTEVGIRSDLREDLYVVLAGLVNGTEQAVFRFTINPLVWWVWYGGMIVALGGLIVMWPGGGSPAVKRSQPGYAVRLVGEQ